MDTHKKDQHIDPEKLGAPPVKGDPMGMAEMQMGMYRKMSEGNPSGSRWVKIFSIIFALFVFIIPGIFLVIAPALNHNQDSKLDTLLPFILGFIILSLGIKTIYSNIRSLLK